MKFTSKFSWLFERLWPRDLPCVKSEVEFTASAQELLLQARSEATAAGHDYCGTEHLLRAFLGNHELIVELNLSSYVDELRDELNSLLPKRVYATPNDELSMTNSILKVIQLAAKEAKCVPVDCVHLFRGLLRNKGCVGEILLRKHHIR